MERDSITTSLEWENLAFSMPFLGNEFGSMGCSSEGLQPIIGLRAMLPPFSTPVPSTPTKRSRTSYHNMQNPCCQVEGCNLDLKAAKDYHRRHRICETHSKSPKVVVAGMECRFCQQCSRFHDLSEFDDMKRSCRRRLSDHNARRRRVQPESSSHFTTSHSPTLYDQRQQNVLNGLPISLSNQRWGENAHTPISRNALIRPNPRILDPSSTNSLAPELLNAHSLLSSEGWNLSDGESASLAGIGHYSSGIQHSELELEPHRSTMFRTGEDQGPSHHHHHHQEYQLFKEPYDCGTFYSTRRSF